MEQFNRFAPPQIASGASKSDSFAMGAGRLSGAAVGSWVRSPAFLGFLYDGHVLGYGVTGQRFGVSSEGVRSLESHAETDFRVSYCSGNTIPLKSSHGRPRCQGRHSLTGGSELDLYQLMSDRSMAKLCWIARHCGDFATANDIFQALKQCTESGARFTRRSKVAA